jgi:hypothetical protein
MKLLISKKLEIIFLSSQIALPPLRGLLWVGYSLSGVYTPACDMSRLRRLLFSLGTILSSKTDDSSELNSAIVYSHFLYPCLCSDVPTGLYNYYFFISHRLHRLPDGFLYRTVVNLGFRVVSIRRYQLLIL